jgi:3-oxoacyl-[acyl-carrier protein] reductase
MRFKDKVVLITGASKGIGKANSLLFAKEGAKIIVNFSKAEKEANDVVKEISKLGSEAIAIKCDVSKEDEVKKMVFEGVKKFGKIDILVNNAGIVFDTPFEKRSVDQFRKTLEVNLIGVFLCSKYVVKHMPKGGRIINISSTNGYNTGGPDSIDYDSSKAGVINMTRRLAKEFAPNINVNSVAPGWVDTEMNKDLPKDYIKEESDKTYLKRFGKPEEIAKAVLFLASDDASFITGTTLVVDGGYT